jgi:hypothetical protein
MSLDRAVHESEPYEGIGFVLTADTPYTGVDLDQSVDEAGDVAEWAMEIVRRLNSYTEITPSGRGLRVWVRGKLPPGRRRKGLVEMYDEGRYFTITGNRLPGTPGGIAERSAELAALHADVFHEEERPVHVPVHRPAPSLSDSELLDKMFRSRNGHEIESLFNGHATRYASGSEADLALCSHLSFWTQCDPEAIDRLFRLSQLCDEKWTERPDYRDRTIAKATEGGECYDPKHGSQEYALAPKAPYAPQGSASGANGAYGAGAISQKQNQPSGANGAYGAGAYSEDERIVRVRTWPDPPKSAAWIGPAGRLALAVEPYTEADPIGVLIQTLVGWGNMIGRVPYCDVNATRHYPNMFCCTAGPTARGRKGTAWDVAKRSLSYCDDEWTANRVTGGLVSGEGLIWEVRDKIEVDEEIRDKHGAARVERVVKDCGVADKRLLCVETELGGTLRILTREGNNLSALIRQAWDSGHLRSMAKNNPNRATDAHISIIGHITEEEVTRHLTQMDAANGFANRFLWVAVRQTRYLPRGSSIPADAVRPVQEELQAAARFASGNPTRMHRDEDAESLWEEVYEGLCKGPPGLLGAVTSRAAAQALRLSMVYALMDRSHIIRREHVAAGLAVWDYCERSARHIFGEALGDKDADFLLSALKSAPMGLKQSEIRSQVFQRHKSADDIQRILSRLLEHDRIWKETIETDGRSATLYHSVEEYAPAP